MIFINSIIWRIIFILVENIYMSIIFPKVKLSKSIFYSFTRWLGILLFAMSLYSLVLVIRVPYPIRPLSQAIRYSLTFVFPSLLLLFFFFFRIPGWWGKLISFTFTMIVFGLSLAGLWSKGDSEYYIISGLIPFVDASAYFNDARRLLEGFQFTDFSAWRPLFPAFLSGIYALAGQNLQVTQAILVATVALSCYLLAIEIQHTHGAAAGAFVITILFFYYRVYSGAMVAENLGLVFGTLGLAVLWREARDHKNSKIYFGVFLVTLALLSRHGAYFLLPGLVIWIGWLFRGSCGFSWRAFGWASGTILFGICFYLVVMLLNYGHVHTPYSYYASIFYDLSTGFQEKHGQIGEDHPEIFEIVEPERTNEIYRLSLKNIAETPFQTISGALKQWKIFFEYGWYAVYGFLVAGTPTVTKIIYAGMYILCLACIFNWFRQSKNVYLTLVIVSVLGIILSVPFVPPQLHNRIRLYAASFPFLAVFPALGLACLLNLAKLEFFLKTPTIVFPGGITVWFGAFLVFITLLGPSLARFVQPATRYQKIHCPEGQETIYVRYTSGSQINIIEEYIMQMDWIPDVHNGRFRWYLHSMPHYDAIEEIENHVSPPATILNGLDLRTGEDYIIIGETTQFPDQSGSVLGICGTRSDNPKVADNHFFFATSIVSVSQ